MFAAAEPRSDRTLETVKMVLALESKQQDYPETLKSYFRDVVKQTIDLLSSPDKFASSASPEAVSLAVTLSSNEVLKATIEEIVQQDSIGARRAKAALSGLEAEYDSTSKFAHFSKDIYAVI